jgi:hypothetical protein
MIDVRTYYKYYNKGADISRLYFTKSRLHITKSRLLTRIVNYLQSSNDIRVLLVDLNSVWMGKEESFKTFALGIGVYLWFVI